MARHGSTMGADYGEAARNKTLAKAMVNDALYEVDHYRAMAADALESDDYAEAISWLRALCDEVTAVLDGTHDTETQKAAALAFLRKPKHRQARTLILNISRESVHTSIRGAVQLEKLGLIIRDGNVLTLTDLGAATAQELL